MFKVNPWTQITLLGPATLGDLRELVEFCNSLRLPDNIELLDCALAIEVDNKGHELIYCGDHVLEDKVYDILIKMHEHSEG